jgi:hypothetical protein
MPIKYAVLNNGNLVIIQWVGKVTAAELLEHNETLIQDTSITPGATALTDTTKGTPVDVDIPSILKAIETHQRTDNPTNISRYAMLVATESLELATAAMNAGEKIGINIIVFASIDVAAVWVGVDPSVIIQTLAELSK